MTVAHSATVGTESGFAKSPPIKSFRQHAQAVVLISVLAKLFASRCWMILFLSAIFNINDQLERN